MNRSTPLSALAAGLLLGLSALHASAQPSWPERPIRVIVPLPPAGPSDIVLRGAAPKVQEILKQPLVIDNKPGANGNIGTAEAVRAAPDGYTWLWTTDTTLTVNPHVYEKMPFKASDLQPVIRASAFSQTLVCNPNVGVKTVAELVKKARATPMTYASGGAGSPGHLTTELFSTAAGIQMTHVPYKGPAPAVQDMLGGQVECGFLAGPTVLPHVKAGKLLALAVSGAKRSPLLPEVPTVAETGYPGFDATFSLVLFAPKDTPAALVQKMHDAMAVALRSPELVERLAQSDQSVVAGNAAETATRLAQDTQRWGEVARRIKLKLD
ncbi:MAG: tripartite tricarboxylate transporter substrate binding protein [Hylemonella sp.]|nr:tripartite tricarboxylate transporter substrate binding protein [Hylemonella sp.]